MKLLENAQIQPVKLDDAFKSTILELYEEKFGDKPDLAIEMAESVIGKIQDELNIAHSEIQKAVNSINSDEWNDSEIKIEPSLSKFQKEMIWSDNWGYLPSYNLECFVGDKASFTVFAQNNTITIDDVLDAGDVDFFDSDFLQADYFTLVNAIRNHGQKTKTKVLTLYTARPIKDRSKFEHVTSIPSNIFLSSSYDEAEGYAKDMGERDIYKIKIKLGNLVKTLDTPSIKNYQAIHKSGNVPIESIERL